MPRDLHLRSGRLFCQCYVALASRFLKANRPLTLVATIIVFSLGTLAYIYRQQIITHVPADLGQSRYKLRPKFHAFHCQIVLHASAGAKLNVRHGSCFNEEDLIGKVTRVTKGAMHASSTCKRILQRWLLQMNAHLCA